MPDKNKVTKDRILKDFLNAYLKNRDWRKAAEEDFEYLLGSQWKDADKEKLNAAGRPALTINKIQPFVFLASGLERQNRTDYVAYPKGEEDGIAADIATMLLRHAIETCNGDYKVSESFEDAITCGKGWIEPYVDYTYDILTGDFKLSKRTPFDIYVDPKSVEYDLSDAEYVVKLTEDLTKDQLISLYPDKESEIEKLGDGKLNLDKSGSIISEVIGDKYGVKNATDISDQTGEINEHLYDLVEYYYKKRVMKYFIADRITGQIEEAKSKEDAIEFVEFKLNAIRKQYADKQTAAGIAVAEGEEPWEAGKEPVVYIKRNIPEIWVACMIGNGDIVKDELCWSYPQWKSYPFIPIFAHRTTTPIKKRENMVQGFVRSLKDPQNAYNKMRSQELNILNRSASVGWLVEEGAWVDANRTAELGSTAGINLEYKKGAIKPEQLEPAQYPFAQAKVAQDVGQDMKELSGMNTDLLALQDSKSVSGRAIMLRQKQGMVMIQRVFDNLSQSKQILGRFILSQLSNIYTVEEVIKVIGDKYIQETFAMPQVDAQGQPQRDEQGNLVMQVNKEEVGKLLNDILNNIDVSKYDVAIGEGMNTESVQVSNQMLLMDLLQAGAPIPPEIIVEESNLQESTKMKIRKAIEEQRAAMAQQQQLPIKT